MTRFPWGTMAPIPYADAKYNVTVNMRANGMIETEADIDENHKTGIKAAVLLGLTDGLAKLASQCIPTEQIIAHKRDIEETIRQKVSSAGYDTRVTINSITCDEASRNALEEAKNKAMTAGTVAPAATASSVAYSSAVRPKFCPNCGSPAGAGNFCTNCGSRLI